MHRSGPRPLGLHLILATMRSGFSCTGLESWKRGSNDWKNPQARQAAARLLHQMAAMQPEAEPGGKLEAEPGGKPAAERNSGGAPAPDPARPEHALPPIADQLGPAILAEALRQDKALIAGIAAYRRHAYCRPDMPREMIWQEGGSSLFALVPPAGSPQPGGRNRKRAGAADAAPVLPPVLLVPSLINRGYVLDLAPGYSLVEWLAAAGHPVFLLEWGRPGALEQGFDLSDYVAGRLERALAAAVSRSGGPVALAGYCMGGLLSLAAALRRPEHVRALALLATPWDFHAAGPEQQRLIETVRPVLAAMLGIHGCLPVDVLQVLFALLEPFAVSDKYRAFGRLPQDQPRAAHFVALEDWLNDGIPLSAPVARDVIDGWYIGNSPARGEWRIAGQAVRPGALRCPGFVAVPSRDRIVPPASALPLAAAIPGAVLHRPEAGHIGMTAGRSAEQVLWRPLTAWLQTV